jgi:hypothetical protein
MQKRMHKILLQNRAQFLCQMRAVLSLQKMDANRALKQVHHLGEGENAVGNVGLVSGVGRDPEIGSPGTAQHSFQ